MLVLHGLSDLQGTWLLDQSKEGGSTSLPGRRQTLETRSMPVGVISGMSGRSARRILAAVGEAGPKTYLCGASGCNMGQLSHYVSQEGGGGLMSQGSVARRGSLLTCDTASGGTAVRRPRALLRSA